MDIMPKKKVNRILFAWFGGIETYANMYIILYSISFLSAVRVVFERNLGPMVVALPWTISCRIRHPPSFQRTPQPTFWCVNWWIFCMLLSTRGALVLGLVPLCPYSPTSKRLAWRLHRFQSQPGRTLCRQKRKRCPCFAGRIHSLCWIFWNISCSFLLPVTTDI